jgi:hypothetical protein
MHFIGFSFIIPLIVLNLNPNWTENMLQQVSFVVSLSTAPLWCRKPASDSCCGEGNDKTDTLCFKYLIPLMAVYCQADHTSQPKINFLLSHLQTNISARAICAFAISGKGRKRMTETDKSRIIYFMSVDV